MNNDPLNDGSVPLAPAAALMSRRFRGFLPVVIDVECGGFHAATDARLRIPMRPEMRSLNVSVAAGIVLSEALRQIGFEEA